MDEFKETTRNLNSGRRNSGQPVKERLRDRLVGWFLDGVIWFAVTAIVLGFSGLGAAIIGDMWQ